MCGICGKVVLGHGPVDENLLARMCRSISCRGPDDRGYYRGCYQRNDHRTVNVGLAHNRLAVIDLSPAGHQPLSNEDGSIWLTYNGEIYNFKELRADLERKGHTFKSETDTEVIVHLYEEKGLGAVEDLNGMFAFAIWDEKKGRLWLCRDRVGIKPLVYYWDKERFVFASEIKAILQDPQLKRKIDPEALYLYLAFNYIPAPRTIFRGIRKLEPGCHLIFEDGNLTISRYWHVSRDTDQCVSPVWGLRDEDSVKRTLRRRLKEAVEARLIADVPLGAFLSGGIDSSIIVALMARYSNQPIKTFSVGFKGDRLFDETCYARDVAKMYGTDHTEFNLTYRDMLNVLPSVMSTFDEPFADSSAIPTFIVSRETRKNVTVALSGDGGDELFAGYRSYLGEFWHSNYMLVPALIREKIIERVAEALPEARDNRVMEYFRRFKKFIRGSKGSFAERVMALKEVFPMDLRRKILLNNDYQNTAKAKDPAFFLVRRLLDDFAGDPINRMLYADLRDALPGDMLTKVDWMSMKNSLEVRVPFLDHRVVELAFSISGKLKIHRGRTKYILRETFKDLLPKSIHMRPKAGFEVPISRWLKTDLRFLLQRYLAEDRIRAQGIFEYETIDRLIKDLFTMRTDTSWMLWNLIVFQYWYEKYF